MAYKRILTIQDISCLGQCSLTVALPILSACGIETCVLPSAVLSTHTGGFTGYTFRDLTDDMPEILLHWEKEKLSFDGFYTGYLGSKTQIDYVKKIMNSVGNAGNVKIVDPAMADGGKLYPGFDESFAAAMGSLCDEADIILPNITEACLITKTDYKEKYDEEYIDSLLKRLTEKSEKTVILTGVSFEENSTGVMVYENGNKKYYKHEKISKGCHGTGDIFASAFAGSFLKGKDAYTSAVIAADYVVDCIKETIHDEAHWYGAKFEPVLGKLIGRLA
ncbi:MAG: pyridoxamine kinase [Lachnospiraceae bacterium]|nr:pyridoxamine kinase [Lachnospiraceae bacterium]